MADPLSSVASIIAVTQFALDLGRHVYQLASHYRNAAAVVESLCQELDGSNRLASHIKDVCLAAATSLGSESQPVVVRDLEASLDQHVNNLKQLQTVIQGLPARTSRKTFDNIRLASKLFKKQRLIEELRSRLASERQNMILLVSSISAQVCYPPVFWACILTLSKSLCTLYRKSCIARITSWHFYRLHSCFPR